MEKTVLEPVYFRLIGGEGEISFVIAHRPGAPEAPRLLFDGARTAVLYRRPGQSVALTKLDEEASETLKKAKTAVFVEPNDDGSAPSVKAALDLGELTYEVPVQIVRRLPVDAETLTGDESKNPFAGKSDAEIAALFHQVREILESEEN